VLRAKGKRHVGGAQTEVNGAEKTRAAPERRMVIAGTGVGPSPCVFLRCSSQIRSRARRSRGDRDARTRSWCASSGTCLGVTISCREVPEPDGTIGGMMKPLAARAGRFRLCSCIDWDQDRGDDMPSAAPGRHGKRPLAGPGESQGVSFTRGLRLVLGSARARTISTGMDRAAENTTVGDVRWTGRRHVNQSIYLQNIRHQHRVKICVLESLHADRFPFHQQFVVGCGSRRTQRANGSWREKRRA
jgi:hypothetical protein